LGSRLFGLDRHSGCFAYGASGPRGDGLLNEWARETGSWGMAELQTAIQGLQTGTDVLFLLMGAILVFAMHGGFAFLEAGTVRHKNQVNALCKILVDFAISTVAYFLIGYTVAYGVTFFVSAQGLSGTGGVEGFSPQGLTLVKFFFLCTFAAAVPAIISGGIAERARFLPQCVATALIVGLFYPFFEGIVWNKNYGLQEHFFKARLGEEFHDFAGSIVVHAVGGWMGFSAVRRLGPRLGRFDKGRTIGIPPSSIPWLAMGSWLLCIGWFGFNVMRP
jgi:Amt family ammonium transporter